MLEQCIKYLKNPKETWHSKLIKGMGTYQSEYSDGQGEKMMEINQTNKLLSRDQNVLMDDTEAILDEILTEMTKKINMVVLTEFAQRGVRHLEVKSLEKHMSFSLKKTDLKLILT